MVVVPPLRDDAMDDDADERLEDNEDISDELEWHGLALCCHEYDLKAENLIIRTHVFLFVQIDCNGIKHHEVHPCLLVNLFEALFMMIRLQPLELRK